MKVRPRGSFVILAALLFFPLCAFGQQDYASRFDFFSGFTYFESPQINLAERGYHLQFGVNMRRWYAVGFDYSNVNGTLNLIPSYLPNALQQQLAPLLGLLGPNYHPAVPTSTTTQTFALGPTLVIRHFKRVGILLHPSLGAVREFAIPHANDPITQVAVGLFFTGSTKLDWQGFYGVGGGLDIVVTKHFGLRLQSDAVYDHLINDILGNGHWTIRASIGPSFHFGRNISR